jgi:hypothetical protein
MMGSNHKRVEVWAVTGRAAQHLRSLWAHRHVLWLFACRRGRHLQKGLAGFIGRRWVRRTLWASAAVLAVTVLTAGGLWWRLSQGPIELDLATPWLKAAI